MKKNNKKLKILIAVFITLNLFSQSCSEEFLDIDANQITANSITDEQAVELVNGIYNIFLSWQVSSFSWIGITSIASDDADKGSDPGDTGSDKHLLDALNHDATSISVAEYGKVILMVYKELTKLLTEYNHLKIWIMN